MATVGLVLERDALVGMGAPAGSLLGSADDALAASRTYESAFPDLHRRAYAAAYKLLGDRAEAEDVAQEALARAFLHWRSIESYAEAWVVRVASNQAIGSWRKRRRLVGGYEADETDAAPGREVGLPDHLELRAALAALPKRQREVVVLRHLGGFSERETAAALGCSAGSVKQHASRGLAALRARLGLPGEGSEA